MGYIVPKNMTNTVVLSGILSAGETSHLARMFDAKSIQ